MRDSGDRFLGAVVGREKRGQSSSFQSGADAGIDAGLDALADSSPPVAVVIGVVAGLGVLGFLAWSHLTSSGAGRKSR